MERHVRRMRNTAILRASGYEDALVQACDPIKRRMCGSAGRAVVDQMEFPVGICLGDDRTNSSLEIDRFGIVGREEQRNQRAVRQLRLLLARHPVRPDATQGDPPLSRIALPCRRLRTSPLLLAETQEMKQRIHEGFRDIRICLQIVSGLSRGPGLSPFKASDSGAVKG